MSIPACESPAGFPCGSTFMLPGPIGMLETLTSCPAEGVAVPATAVICHPHPLYGGTLHNKVVHTMAKTFGELGLRTVRFNFRGVGASEGSFGDAEGEVEDLLAVLAWARRERPNDQLWLAGFSFGGYVAARAAQQQPVSQLVTIAPAVNMYYFKSVQSPPNVPWLVIHGDADDLVPFAAIQEWVKRMQPPPTLVILKEAEHFFHGRLQDLRHVIVSHLKDRAPRA
ncbi:MAG TPA: alpha/beta fold hydrolase [Burkholderiales bacterium]|nr:alpha/beta fold hydrolase [Burkholderiales bacterium]